MDLQVHVPLRKAIWRLVFSEVSGGGKFDDKGIGARHVLLVSLLFE